MSARTGLAGLTMLALMMAGAMNAPAQAPSVMTHHMHEVTSTGQQLIGRLPANQTLQLDLVLPLRDPEGLDQFLSEVYDPNSANYRHFLTVPEFTARFGPTQKDYDAVLRFARENGLAVVGGSRDGMEVQVKGSVLAIESAFHVNMQVYRHPTESRNYFAPDREPSTNLPFALWHISGLENFSLPHPLYQKKEDYAAAHGIRPEAVVAHATTGSGPSASFLGSDMRAAYYGSGSLTGAGQNLGLLEYYGTDLADLTTYYKNIGQTNTVPITLLSTDGTSTSCLAPGCDDTEQELDITQALGMAPGLASLTVYVGSSDTAIISAMTTHSPLPTTIGCSWGWTPIDPSTLDPYFKKMAAQGQNFFAASGDSSTWSRTVTAWPADDPYVVSVGGTDLVTASAGGPLAVGDRLGKQRWRHQCGRHCHSRLAAALRRHHLRQQGINHAAQWPGCFGQCKLHLLHLLQPDHLPGQLLRRHQLCRAHVGRLHRPCEPATGLRRLRAHRIPQPHHLRAKRNLQLHNELP